MAAEVGAGRRRVDEELDHGAGVLVHSRIGDRVESGEPLATLLVGERVVDQKKLAERIQNAFTIDDQPVEPPALILGTVDEV